MDEIMDGLARIVREEGLRAKSALGLAESSLGKDVKLDLDRELHRRVVGSLRTLAGYPVLSEEDEEAPDFNRTRGLIWIVDPLDGSLNHLRGIPLSCISVALWDGPDPVAGVVYDYNRDELFSGVVGAGAVLNGVAVGVSGLESPADAVLCTGFPSFRDFGHVSLKGFVLSVQRWKKLRLLGSAALSLAYVASGRADGYFEEDIRIWDVAAGLALVKSAGGEVLFRASGRPNFVHAAATNGKISTSELLR